MAVRKLMAVFAIAAGGLLVGLAPSAQPQPQAHLALQDLQSDFHGANTVADYELMHSLWADDAVFISGAGTFTGPDEITDFLASVPTWGTAASLAPTYKSTYSVHGNTASFQFECILVNTGGMDPLTTSLSTIPFGGQNPGVEIVQHSTATCTAVKKGGTWLFKTFNGSAGPPM